MKAIQRLIILFLCCATVSLSAGTLWSGNAVRGSEDDFSGYYDRAGTMLGASRALPAGTVIEVTNQLNEESVTVTIIGENARPGVFLLLSPEASLQVSLDKGEMILVQAQEKPGSGNSLFQDYQDDRDAYLEENAYDEPLKSNDPDNNILALSQEELNAINSQEETPLDEVLEEAIVEEEVPEEVAVEEELIDEVLIEEVAVEEVLTEEVPEEIPEETELIEEPEDYDEVVVGNFGSREVIPLVEPAGPEESFEEELFPVVEEAEEEEPKEEEIPAEEVPAEEVPAEEEMIEESPVEEIPEEPIEEALEENPVEEVEETEPVEEPVTVDRVIYFLTPAPLKPPEVVHVEENGEDTTVSLIPQEVTSEELNGLMAEPLQKGKRYIQVASFSIESIDSMYQKMAELKIFFPMVLLEPDESNENYRLLVGPASRDEMGVLLKYHLPAQGFNDAMEFNH